MPCLPAAVYCPAARQLKAWWIECAIANGARKRIHYAFGLQGPRGPADHRRTASILEDCVRSPQPFDAVKSYLAGRSIAFEVRPRLVRGLDYYMRTTFEIVHGALGSQNSVLGGGRYDGLAEALGSKIPAPGIGFSIGEDSW